MVIDIWQSIVKSRRVKVSRQIDIMQAVINMLDEHFDEMADPDGTVDTRVLREPTFIGRLKEEVGRMRGDVGKNSITLWFKNRYNAWIKNILGRANNRLRDNGYVFHHHSGGSNPRSSFISRLRTHEKEDWKNIVKFSWRQNRALWEGQSRQQSTDKVLNLYKKKYKLNAQQLQFYNKQLEEIKQYFGPETDKGSYHRIALRRTIKQYNLTEVM
tara:strand:+ start:911 stop:1552 length:642 start_codon:yes stop_codon:yes gene_type:complete